MSFLDKIYRAVGKNPNSMPDNEHTQEIKKKAVLQEIQSLREAPRVVKDDKMLNELVSKLLKSEAMVGDLRDQLGLAKPSADLERKIRSYQSQLRILSKDILNHPEFKKLRWQYEELQHQSGLDAKTIREYFSDELNFKKDAKLQENCSPVEVSFRTGRIRCKNNRIVLC